MLGLGSCSRYLEPKPAEQWWKRLFQRVEPYPTARYVRLLNTFSPHRMLLAGQRERLLAGIAEVVDAHGGVLRVLLDTYLAMGRRAG